MLAAFGRAIRVRNFSPAYVQTRKAVTEAFAINAGLCKAVGAAAILGGLGSYVFLRQTKPSNGKTCVVVLRHGEREDYMAQKAGRGLEWVSKATRPWDPQLAPNGQDQAKAAAKRLKDELAIAGIRQPIKIFTSPLVRCVETANIVADEFSIESLHVEEGLVEAVCEMWMRQWALPGSDSTWGGPPGASVKEAWSQNICGPPNDPDKVRPEAHAGLGALLLTPQELRAGGWQRVDTEHRSAVLMRGKPLRWGQFETKEMMSDRCVEQTVRKLAMENPGATLVFVTHGSKTRSIYEHLALQKLPSNSGGMTALSVLTLEAGSDAFGPWEVHVANDNTHARIFARGEETLI
eukprot:TRINITY_DN29075_c0_g1_i1.p1 TRINITY_DN29075_c0_g1~~TRINITY_DN29075_c0_g1_i1.p1  ORF type:complete len:365 (-),score=50.16 TRINITY_DN29075_c0_g1_i1:616-1662(-)